MLPTNLLRIGICAMEACARHRETFSVAVDLVVWTLQQEDLSLLLVRRRNDPFLGFWALPGGFVGPGENLEEAAKRELREETGVEEVPLLQFGAFGEPRRDPRGRVLSVAYTTLVDRQRMMPRAGSDAETVAFFPFRSLPPLAFDHGEIVRCAYRFLRRAVWCTGIAASVLPAVFSLTELRSVYRRILQEEPARRLIRGLLGPQGLLEEAGTRGSRRLYRFRGQGLDWLRAGEPA